jgi:CubicO group peptidase (beta-lactamase class C family)
MFMKDFILKRSTPEEQGVRSEAILRFVEAIEQSRTEDMDQDLHSFILLRHGHVISEGWWQPYEKDMSHVLFSLSKSFTSTAIGFAVSEKLLTVEDLVVSYFKEECPNPTSHLSHMRIKDLLSMSTGHVVDTTSFLFNNENWAKAFLQVPVEKEPGTYFLYNTGATYMLSVIVQKVTGLKLLEYLRTRLFDPLGIVNPTWEECPMGYNTGGFGLSIRTEDIAKFGQFYLNKGCWDGKQLLPSEWIEEATDIHISNGNNPDSDWSQGYGYQFWRCRQESYRGDGAFGQYCIIMPKYDMVLAMTGGLKDMQAPLNILWSNLLPGIEDEALPAGNEYKQLMDKLNSLRVLLPQGKTEGMIPPAIENKWIKLKEEINGVQRIAFNFQKNSMTVTLETSKETYTLPIGIGYWSESVLGMNIDQHRDEMKLRLTGIWQSEDTLIIHCRFVESPFATQYHIRFTQHDVEIKSKRNVSFEDTKWETVRGTIELSS